MIKRLFSFFRKQQLDAELDAEMAAHLDMAIADNQRRGMSEDEARRQALIRFGGVTQAKENQRDARGLPWLEVLRQDLHFAFRTLAHDRGFTAIAVLILGLGIGANVAVFSVVNTLLLRPLPLGDPQQLVRILSKNPKGGESSMTFSTDATQELQRQNQSFASVSGYFAFSTPDNLKLTGKGQPVPVTGLLVDKNFFSTLRVAPMLGRDFTNEEALDSKRPAALLSYAFWKRQYHGDRNIVGQTIDVNSGPVTVVGVLPPEFDFGSIFSPGYKVDMYWPFVYKDFRDDGNVLAFVARLKPGVTVGEAQAEADQLFPTLNFDERHPEYSHDYTANIVELKDYVTGKLRRSLVVLWCAVGMILLIVCVNLSNLLLARGAARTKEFAMRTALGATHGRLIRQLLTESLMLSFAGALLGLGIAFAVTMYLAHQGSIALPLLSSVRIDAVALAWTVVIAFAAAILFGIVPAMRISSGNLQESLKDSGHGASDGRRHQSLRSVLIVSEIALACVLLVSAGLLLRSFLRILDVDLGFQPSQAASISVDYDDGGKAQKRNAYWQDLITRVEAIPGVETAGITDDLPMSRNRSWGISPKGRDIPRTELEDTFVYVVSPGYLDAMGIRLVRGRDIQWNDTDPKLGVVIVNETVANRLWPGQDPIGQIASVGGSDVRVIGVAADVRESSVEGKPGWQMYLSGGAPQFGPVGTQLVIRTKLPPQSLASTVMTLLRQRNPGQPANEFRPIQGLVDHAVSPRRFFVLLVAIFAGLGLVLASLGIYGVISYSVTQRTQEIGIRMALGASQGRVQRTVIAKTLLLSMAGIATGTVASLAMSRLIASMLFGTAASDPITYVATLSMLLVVALLAGYLPARRASRINPMIALRNN